MTALAATLVAAGAVVMLAPTRAQAAPATLRGEYLFEVLRDWRRARQRGEVDVTLRLGFAQRALSVADAAKGRERYEALRFVANLEGAGDSAALLEARDRALERVIGEFIDDGDIMGEFVLRVLRNDAHDSGLRARVSEATRSDSVRAACLFHAIEPVFDRALDGGDISAPEREGILARLVRIGAAYGDAKHPLSAQTWGTFTAAHGATIRDLILVGDPAPEIVGSQVDGSELRLSALRGKVVLLCFWGEWCPPCRVLYPRQRALVQRHAASSFVLLGVNSDPQASTLAAAVAKAELRWPNLWDTAAGTSGPIATRWRVRVWPTWCLIDTQGFVRNIWRGAPSAGELDAALEAWLPKSAR